MESLEFRPLTHEDTPRFSWTGGRRHIEYVNAWIDQAAKGELVVLGIWEGEEIIGLGYVDFIMVDGVGTLSALNIREDKRSQGLGSLFIEEFEKIVRERGLPAIELRVETSNPRAKTLYERLGFVVRGTSVEEWEQDTPDGGIEIYKTDALIMRKELN